VLLAATAAILLAVRQGLFVTLVLLAAVSQLSTLLYTTIWLAFEAHERLQHIVYAELGARLFVIALASALLASGAGIVAAAAAFMLGNVLELAITYHLVTSRFYRPEFGASVAELREIARMSLPIGILAALVGALQQTDRVLLRIVCDQEAVGIYSAAWVLSDNFRMIADLFLGASFAAGMRLYVRDGKAFGVLYKSSMVAAALLGMPVAAGVFVLAPDIIGLVYGEGAYAPAATVLRILVCDVPVTFAFQVGTLPLLAARREVAIVKLLIGALAANVILDLLLMPRHRAAGAATSTLLVSVGCLVSCCVMTARWMRLVDMWRVIAVTTATALMAGAAYGARQCAGMWAAIGVGVLVYVPLLIALRAVSWHDLRGLLRGSVPAPASPAA
jgi:O-antigen/teichoic acid export membrane protein